MARADLSFAAYVEVTRFVEWVQRESSWDDVRDDFGAEWRRYMQARNAPTERYERLAAMFLHDTGHLAPGKDCPAALDSPERQAAALAAWQAWIAS